jgi:Na+-translocating ferredoxin:NAD+ oxidoreductase subunit B
MSEETYRALADALDRLPNGFPRTPSGVELRLLAKLCAPEEAAVACLMGREPEGFEAIAARGGLAPAEARHRLISMARRGLVWPSRAKGGLAFRLAPFVFGIWESQVDDLDHELVHLFEEYMAAGGARGIMGADPAIHRVLPAHGAVKSEKILPYEDVRAIIMDAKAWSVQDCICRKEKDIAGNRACSFPLHNCLSFSAAPRAAAPNDITKEQALALLDQAEELGLVHSVSNIRTGMFYVCNCCGCCCGILRGITELGIQGSVAAAPYLASVDAEACTGCGVCVTRCQVKAIHLHDGVAHVAAARCIGCGLCVTGCAAGAASLSRKAEEETVIPPEDFAAWERERLRSRGLPGG